MDIETRLRDDLASRATDIAAAPADLYGTVLAGHRRQQRRRLGVLAAGACALVAAVAVPLAAGGDGGQDRIGPGSSSAPALTAGYEPYAVAPRGSLAADPAYVDALLGTPWSGGPPEETRHVVFAGDVGGGTSALVIGYRDGGWTALDLRGPAGAAPEDLAPAGEPQPVDPGAWMQITTEDAVVVIALPGDAIEVSPRQEPGPDGVPTSAPYRPVGDATGIAVLDAVDLGAAAVRITRDGAVVHEGPLGTAQAAAEGGVDGLDLGAALAAAAGEPDESLVRQLVVGAAVAAGEPAGGLAVEVLWGGPIGTREDPVDAAVVAVSLDSGVRVLVGGMAMPAADGGTVTGPCLRSLLPAGADLAGQVVPMRCDLYDPADGSPLGSRLVVVAPDGTASVRLTGVSGAVLDERVPDGPVSVGPAPEGLAAVAALDADGRVLAEAPVGRIEGLPHD
ncbi:hypothetical protein [Blastococcus sp. TF02A-26]|uniref:hypothetical protein n=1 Tax=Blastococcus sp. TF02A-26 TaxID=2250577 RepID=UPI000DEA8FC8|nr:hypothetical protein [Blastococcus sp. TF02A-26]RBY79730.1 hypothetical protein DQ240_22145 [Blastococcus sp. TF02A-26]